MKGNRGVDRWAMAGVAAALGMGAAWVAAAFLALLIAPLSRDQPLGAAALGEWAWRWGRVLAVLLAAAASLGRAPVASPSLVARQAGWTVGVLLALALLAAVLALVAVRLHLWGRGWELQAPAAYGARLAASAAAEALGLPLAWWMALGLWRQRQLKRSSGGSQVEGPDPGDRHREGR
jgi:hypothetical protein